jgi:hypothetical protein
MPDLPMADRPEVALPEAPAELRDALAAAVADADPRTAIGRVVATTPTYLDGWAALAAVGRDDIEQYAFARVGYHRGLDAIRRHGWGGRGYVRWRHDGNRGFLTCLARLRDAARAIGEDDEVTRIDDFLVELDPDWDDAWVS